MSWNRRFSTEEFLKNSLWLVPVLGIILGFLLESFVVSVEQQREAPETFQFSASIASTLLTSIVAAMISFVGFVLTILVLVVQFAGVSFSPRTLLFIFRDKQLKLSISLFVGTMTYSFLLLTEISDDFVPNWGILIAGGLVLASLLLFLQFLSHLLHGIRPANLAHSIGKVGHQVISATYPNPAPPPGVYEGIRESLIPAGPPDRIVTKQGFGEIVQSVDVRGLVAEASKAGAVFVLPHAIGDFVRNNGEVIEIHGPCPSSDARLAGYIAVGPERTVDQDPAYALRVLVDIAIKGLSPAINDPTTATNAIDRIEDLLIDLVGRDLEAGIYRDRHGEVRVIMDTPSWDNFLLLGVTEIRRYGSSSVQTMRRLGALLAALMDAAPVYRKAPIQREIAHLERTVHSHIADPDDQELASVSDAQGIGAPNID
jgi:uncharacterized membrane protein